MQKKNQQTSNMADCVIYIPCQALLDFCSRKNLIKIAHFNSQANANADDRSSLS